MSANAIDYTALGVAVFALIVAGLVYYDVVIKGKKGHRDAV